MSVPYFRIFLFAQDFLDLHLKMFYNIIGNKLSFTDFEKEMDEICHSDITIQMLSYKYEKMLSRYTFFSKYCNVQINMFRVKN